MPRAADLKDVARKDTLVVSGFGTGLTEILDPQNMNPYSLGGLGRVRDILNKTIFEFLYLYNHNTGEEIPWLATSYTTAPDGMSVDVTLRDGVEWSDGQPFTSDDVKYTHRAAAGYAVAGVCRRYEGMGQRRHGHRRDRTSRINLNKPQRPLLLLSTSSRTPRSTSRSCPSTSGRARIPRPSPTPIRHGLAGRHRARTRWSTRPARRRSSIATTTGGAPRPASSRCPSRCA